MTDPRERLIIAGNEVLEAVYAEQKFNQKYKHVMDVLHREGKTRESVDEALALLPDREKGTFIAQMMVTSTARDAAVKNYTMLRETIESLLGTRIE